MTSPPKEELPAEPAERALVRPLRKARRDALTRVRHDLRSLVHSVVGYSDLLANPSYGTLSPEQRRFVDHVRTAADQLQELVDTCIELSRPAGEAPPLEPAEVPLGAALRHVQAGLASEALFCGLELSADIEQRACAVELSVLVRAMRSLALVVSRDGTVRCMLRAHCHTDVAAPTVCLSTREEAPSAPLCRVDALEDAIGNRDFVRLKLSEALLCRLGICVKLTSELDHCELTFV